MLKHPSLRWLVSFAPRASATGHSLRRSKSPEWRPNQHLESAIAWLLYAHSIGKDGGVPAFYDLLRDAWMPSYPETTGYIIPTLLRYAERYSDHDVRRVGLEMAEFLLQVQTPEGAIRGWSPDSPVYVFDTGQVLFGWLAALQETGNASYRMALLRSADWLVAQQEPGGYWAQYQFGEHLKTWDVRVAWPLVLVGRAFDQRDYVEAGRRCLEWALTHQDSDGWFRYSSLEPNEPPVTHTIAYTVEALLESGILLGEKRYIEAARCTADALLAQQRPDGGLSTYWAPGWQPLNSSSCLTGDAQMALCWLRLCQLTGETRYVEAAQRTLAFVASTQSLDGHWPPVRGAIAGSWPIWGHYLRWRYPNWAVKFFSDALMLHQELVA